MNLLEIICKHLKKKKELKLIIIGIAYHREA
jgi:hypothetical protein